MRRKPMTLVLSPLVSRPRMAGQLFAAAEEHGRVADKSASRVTDFWAAIGVAEEPQEGDADAARLLPTKAGITSLPNSSIERDTISGGMRPME